METSSLLTAACEQATNGLLWEARSEFQKQIRNAQTPCAVTLNNLATVEAALGHFTVADDFLTQAKLISPSLATIEQNQKTLRQSRPAPSVCRDRHNTNAQLADGERIAESDRTPARRIAIVSLLFNWPSTGGGTVHTKELADFLSRSGYEICHFYAVNASWRVGSVQGALPYQSVPLVFTDQEWNTETIRDRFREGVTHFAPDAVIVTDSWNTKPLLCEAVSEFPYFIRIAALETLCPLNNVRLLIDEHQQPQQCEQHQLCEPQACFECVSRNQNLSGGLHQAERQLGGFFADAYPARLQQSFAKSAGVLAVNPTIADLFRPYAPHVHVVPSGFDEDRFPAEAVVRPSEREKKILLFAGLTNECMKGFRILQQAGELLWRERQDFEIVATADPIGQVNDFIRFVGWQTQETLPQVIRDCDILVFPTIAQEALGRTAVEAMGCGRPVIASNIGGLSWVVEEGVTGLLCEAGNPYDLATKCSQLLDDPAIRIQLGINGRQKFEREFTWNQIIKNHYFQLFGAPIPEAAVV